MNLDDKLREILQRLSQYVLNGNVAIRANTGCTTDEAIAQIKQAFADEQNLVMSITPDPKTGGLMTGQKWYDRYQDAITEVRVSCSRECLDTFMAVARRAAGLEEK